MPSKPPARSDSTDSNARLAVLIDADNAQASVIEGLLVEIARFGEATVKRIYGDFTSTHSAAWKQVLQKFAIMLELTFRLEQIRLRRESRQPVWTDNGVHGSFPSMMAATALTHPLCFRNLSDQSTRAIEHASNFRATNARVLL